MPTLLAMRTAVLREADLQLGQVDSDDVDALLNTELAALDELLVEAYQGWRVTTSTLVITAGTDSIALPAAFFQAVDLEEYSTPSAPRQLPRVEFMERHAPSDWGWYVYGLLLYVKPTSKAPGTYRLWYVPTFTALVLDVDVYDAPNGWEVHAILGAAIRLRNMQELSASGLEQRQAAVGERIANAARKRQGRRKVRDVRGERGPIRAWRDDDLVE
jgi:hypothetical protein